MGFTQNRDIVAKEIEKSLNSIDVSKVEEFLQIMLSSKAIFCDGMGRTELQVKGFVMRLAQMGLAAHDVSSVTTPATTKDDVLLICSGSGETENLVAHAKKAKKIGAKIALISSKEQSSIADIADVNIVIKTKVKNDTNANSIQPLGALFGQASGAFMDLMVIELMQKVGISEKEMIARHKNLE